MEICTAYYSLWKNGAIAILGTGFTIIALLMVNDASSAGPSSWFALLFFGYIMFAFGMHTLDRRPQLIISKNGLTSAKHWVGFIPWSEITEINIIGLGKGAYVIAIHVTDTEAWLGKLPVLYRISWKIRPNWRRIIINFQNMDVPIFKVHSAIDAFTFGKLK